jgi:hypothetical protein
MSTDKISLLLLLLLLFLFLLLLLVLLLLWWLLLQLLSWLWLQLLLLVLLLCVTVTIGKTALLLLLLQLLRLLMLLLLLWFLLTFWLVNEIELDIAVPLNLPKETLRGIEERLPVGGEEFPRSQRLVGGAAFFEGPDFGKDVKREAGADKNVGCQYFGSLACVLIVGGDVAVTYLGAHEIIIAVWTENVDVALPDVEAPFLVERSEGGGGAVDTPHVDLWCSLHCKYVMRHVVASGEAEVVPIGSGVDRRRGVGLLPSGVGVLPVRFPRRVIGLTAVNGVVRHAFMVCAPLLVIWIMGKFAGATKSAVSCSKKKSAGSFLFRIISCVLGCCLFVFHVLRQRHKNGLYFVEASLDMLTLWPLVFGLRDHQACL